MCSANKKIKSFGDVRRRCDPDALSDFNQVSCLAFNMTICGTTPRWAEPPYPAISSQTVPALYHFPVTKWLASCCGVLMRGREGRWRETTGRLVLHFLLEQYNTQDQSSILHLSVYYSHFGCREKLRATQQLLVLKKILFEKSADFAPLKEKTVWFSGCN